MKFFLGEYTVVQSRYAGGITIDLGKGVYTTIHLGDFQHDVKVGDKLPLFTEIPRKTIISSKAGS